MVKKIIVLHGLCEGHGARLRQKLCGAQEFATEVQHRCGYTMATCESQGVKSYSGRACDDETLAWRVVFDKRSGHLYRSGARFPHVAGVLRVTEGIGKRSMRSPAADGKLSW